MSKGVGLGLCLGSGLSQWQGSDNKVGLGARTPLKVVFAQHSQTAAALLPAAAAAAVLLCCAVLCCCAAAAAAAAAAAVLLLLCCCSAVVGTENLRFKTLRFNAKPTPELLYLYCTVVLDYVIHPNIVKI